MGNLRSKCTTSPPGNSTNGSISADSQEIDLSVHFEIDETNDFDEQYDTLRRSQRRRSKSLSTSLNSEQLKTPSALSNSCPPSPLCEDSSTGQTTDFPEHMSTSRFGFKPSTGTSTRGTSGAKPCPPTNQTGSNAGKTTSSAKSTTTTTTRVTGKTHSTTKTEPFKATGLPRIRPSTVSTSGQEERRKTMPVRSTVRSANTASVAPHRMDSSVSKPPLVNRLRQLFHLKSVHGDATPPTSAAPTQHAHQQQQQTPQQHSLTPRTRRKPKLTTSKTVEALHPVSKSNNQHSVTSEHNTENRTAQKPVFNAAPMKTCSKHAIRPTTLPKSKTMNDYSSTQESPVDLLGEDVFISTGADGYFELEDSSHNNSSEALIMRRKNNRRSDTISIDEEQLVNLNTFEHRHILQETIEIKTGLMKLKRILMNMEEDPMDYNSLIEENERLRLENECLRDKLNCKSSLNPCIDNCTQTNTKENDKLKMKNDSSLKCSIDSNKQTNNTFKSINNSKLVKPKLSQFAKVDKK